MPRWRAARRAAAIGLGTPLACPYRRRLWLAVLLLNLSAAAQTADRSPHLGYLYPAGGRIGTTFRVTAGGQWLRGASAAYLSGGGLAVRVVEHIEPLRPNQIGDAARYAAQLVQHRRALTTNPEAEPPEWPELPDHPLLRGIDEMTDDELNLLRGYLFDPKRQPNAQIAEQVELEVTIAPDAAPGEVELRLVTEGGLTNPMTFQLGLLREQNEEESWRQPSAVTELESLPALVNGQIMPGDRDRIRFRGRRGQKLVVEAQARRLIPYLADAVPGWFQATLALYDAAGRELAYLDDFRGEPDPVLACALPETGDYEVEIRDSIYRGREDFVYRLTIGELPFISHLFPLGGTLGRPARVNVAGWNLIGDRLDLDTSATGLRYTALGAGRICREVPYAVDELPELSEAEPNDQTAQAVEPPLVVNGRIGRPGDVDRFALEGRAGDELVVEVNARRLRSPLDSLLRLRDAGGAVVAWNDDLEDRAFGLITHHADSYLRATLPASGRYDVELSDAQAHGGDEFAYRLRIGPPEHDYALRVAPATLNIGAGRVALLDVWALRGDGFDAPIDLVISAAPGGFALSGGRIPAGQSHVRMTLTAPDEPLDRPVALRLEGRSTVGGEPANRPAVPADNQMQAFLWTHLVPVRDFAVSVIKPSFAAPAGHIAAPVRLPAGGSATAKVVLPARPNIGNVEFALAAPPAGVSLSGATAVDDGIEFVIEAAGEVSVGLAGNLIIEVYLTGRQTWLGLVPAVPFEIVAAGG